MHEWGTEIHGEAEELRSLEDTEDPEDNWEPDEDSLQGRVADPDSGMAPDPKCNIGRIWVRIWMDVPI